MGTGFATVSIDVDYLDRLPCIVDRTERWNGWACPLFPRVSAERIVATIDDDEYTSIRWDGDTVVLTQDPGSADEYTERIDGTIIDGVRYWPIGGWSWTWSIDDRRTDVYVDPDETVAPGWRAFITTEDAEWHGRTVLAAWDAMTSDRTERYTREA